MATTYFTARGASKELNIPLEAILEHVEELGIPRAGKNFAITQNDFPRILQREGIRLKNQIRTKTAEARTQQTKLILCMQQASRLAGLIPDPAISQKLVELGRVIDSEVSRSPGMNATPEAWSRFSAQACAFAHGPEFAKAQKIFSEVSELIGK